MPQQVTILVLPPYIPGQVIDNFYPLKLQYHPSICNERFWLGNAMAMLFLTKKTWHPVPSLPTDTSNVVVGNDILDEEDLTPGSKPANWHFKCGRSSIPCHASYYFNTPIPCLRICLEILTEICNIFRVIDMTKHTWKPHSWNVIQRSRSRDETQGHVIPATSMGPVGKFMLRWKNACAKSICCGRRYKLLWVALLHNMRWCISVAHYDSQYIAEWYLRKLGI